MSIPYDWQSALVTDWKTYLVEHRHDMFTVPCIEGTVDIRGNWLLINVALCMPLITRRRPVSRDKHLMLSGIYGAVEHAKRTNEVSKSLEAAGYTRESLGHDIITTVETIHNLCYTHLPSCIHTVDIFSMADTILAEEVVDICTPDYGDITDMNINRMEDAFRKQSGRVISLFSGDTLNTNVFRAPLICGALRAGQFAQFVFSAGPKTDTDDHIFLRPVRGGFLSGMYDIVDLAIESRSASKSTNYSKQQMRITQYMNRQIHLQTSVIRHLYQVDCGSTTYLDYIITEHTAVHYLGKFYLNPKGKLVEITRDNLKDVIDRPIKVRSIPGCRHTDGFCVVCGGTITKSFSKDGDVGFLANVNTGALVAQQVLSAKHLTSTDAVEYEVPSELSDILMAITNDIFVKPSIKMEKVALGFLPKEIAKINDLKHRMTENEYSSAYFSDMTITHLDVGTVQPDGSVKRWFSRTPMGGMSKTYPHLSAELLAMLRSNPDELIQQNNIAWIKLGKLPKELPVMQCTVVNNSIKDFVDQFRSFITKDVAKYTSVNDFIHVLSKFLWNRVSPHITHIECLARACMITDRANYIIPEITDPNNVMFGTLGKNITMRSVGSLFAFEGYNAITDKNTVTYLTAKPTDIMDEYMGYTDICDRDQYWPEFSDRLQEEEFV